MTSIEDAFKQIPPVTRTWLALVMLTAIFTQFGSLNPYSIVWHPYAIYSNFEVWRIFTAFVYFGPFGLPFFFSCLFLYRYGGALEENPFSTTPGAYRGGVADHLFMVIFCALSNLLICTAAGSFRPASAMIFSLIYVWSKRNPTAPTNIWGFRLQAAMLPWALVGLSVMMGENPLTDLCGIVAGHIYYALVEVLPLKYGRTFITTPRPLIELCDWVLGGTTYNATPQGNAVIPPRYGHNWGAGRRLA